MQFTINSCLVLTCFPILVVMYTGLLVAFYKVQNTEFCGVCRSLECVPYVSQFCNYQP